MPNEINPNDYNIDFFASDILGITTATNFRDYLLNKNLTDLPDELVNGAAGNFTNKYQDKGQEKSINYTQISDPGNLDEWLLEGNFSVTSHEVRDIGMLTGNIYGPPSIQSYSYLTPELLDDSTGFLQYPTSSGGDDYKQILLNQQLNLGPGSAINFPSKLNDIAKERRKQEALNRLKLNTENTVLGAINLDPVGLAAGQDLIVRDYKITSNPTLAGKITEFFTDSVDINLPVSPIPAGAFGKYGDTDGPESYSDLIKSTGEGTKSLIYSSVSYNKYGPTLNEPKGLLANVFGAGQAAQKNTYLTPPLEIINTGQLEIPLIDKINRAVGNAIDAVTKLQIENDDTILLPTESDNPSISIDNIQQNAELGFSTLPSAGFNDTWNLRGPLSKFEIPSFGLSIPIPDDGPDGPIGTKIPLDVNEDFYPGNAATNGTKNNAIPYDRGMYWGNQTTNPFRRGILKYTQDLINNSNNTKDYKDKARYIGVTNDAANYDSATGRHKNYSMGNTVTDSENGYYCRSWSVRNPYKKVSDLIRHGATKEDGTASSLTRDDLGLSVLGSNGFVKVAPYVSRDNKGKRTNTDSGFDGTTLVLGNPAVQKYMLSLENLAWQNTEHILNVSPCEVGPNGGRIMWFPPYNISFTDNTSVEWEATKFIGRGEPVYTYNSTERTGTLSFTLIIDHSMAMTEIKEKGEQALFRYFAGCDDPIEEFAKIAPPAKVEEIKVQQKEEDTKTDPPVSEEQPAPEKKEFVVTPPSSPPVNKLQFYFRNARYFEKDSVGTKLETEMGPNADEKQPNYKPEYTRKWPNGYLRATYDDTPPVIVTSNTFDPTQEPTTAFNPAYTATSESQLDSLNEKAYQDMFELIQFLLSPDGKRYKIKIIGKTSDAGPTSGNKSNQKLAETRAKSTKDYILKNMLEIEGNLSDPVFKANNLGSEKTYPTEKEWRDSDLRWEVLSVGEVDSSLSVTYDDGTGQKSEKSDENRTFGDANTSVPAAIRDRTTLITLEYNKEIDDSIIGPAQIVDPNATPINSTASNQTEATSANGNTTTNAQVNNQTSTNSVISESEKKQKQRQKELLENLAQKGARYMAWECSYFEEMKQEDSFIYESLTEKLKYFHPAFHSMTPEGFNARLTFLQQCTRQGPNIALNEPSNLAFGKPPICVLRIGDFYHTKIVIDSVNFSFDPLQWDLNPEGIGVQPMLCNVDLNFKFIGGSSLGGPISQLQNAVSFNFFANTALYNPRTIYTSVGEYAVKRRDPWTNELVEVSNKVETYNSAGSGFEYGAFITPNESFKSANNNSPTSSNNTGSQNTQPNPNNGSVTGDPSKATLDKQLQDQGIVATDATPTEEQKQAIENEVNKNEEINKNTDNKGVGDDNQNGNESKVIKGFDKKTGQYTTQYTQNIKKTKYDGPETVKVPSGTRVFRTQTKDVSGNLIIYIQQTQEINTVNTGVSTKSTEIGPVIKNNRLTTTCGRKDFLYNNGGTANDSWYDNTPFLNVIKQVFCKGNKDKTWKELTS